MQQLGFTKEELKEKVFMQEYMREYFGIEDIFGYAYYNQKLFHRLEQLKNISFAQNY